MEQTIQPRCFQFKTRRLPDVKTAQSMFAYYSPDATGNIHINQMVLLRRRVISIDSIDTVRQVMTGEF